MSKSIKAIKVGDIVNTPDGPARVGAVISGIARDVAVYPSASVSVDTIVWGQAPINASQIDRDCIVWDT